jgi:hypothetical protein
MNRQPFAFHKDTPQTVCALLTSLNASRERVRIWYGDTVTGQAWQEEHDVTGSIGKSTGSQPLALLIHSTRSYGGGALLDHCIIRIDHIATHITLYQHPSFTAGKYEIETDYSPDAALPALVIYNNEHVASFPTYAKAKRYIDFMLGKRYTL